MVLGRPKQQEREMPNKELTSGNLGRNSGEKKEAVVGIKDFEMAVAGSRVLEEKAKTGKQALMQLVRPTGDKDVVINYDKMTDGIQENEDSLSETLKRKRSSTVKTDPGDPGDNGGGTNTQKEPDRPGLVDDESTGGGAAAILDKSWQPEGQEPRWADLEEECPWTDAREEDRGQGNPGGQRASKTKHKRKRKNSDQEPLTVQIAGGGRRTGVRAVSVQGTGDILFRNFQNRGFHKSLQQALREREQRKKCRKESEEGDAGPEEEAVQGSAGGKKEEEMECDEQEDQEEDGGSRDERPDEEVKNDDVSTGQGDDAKPEEEEEVGPMVEQLEAVEEEDERVEAEASRSAGTVPSVGGKGGSAAPHRRGEVEESRVGTVPEVSDEGGSNHTKAMTESEEGGNISVEESHRGAGMEPEKEEGEGPIVEQLKVEGEKDEAETEVMMESEEEGNIPVEEQQTRPGDEEDKGLKMEQLEAEEEVTSTGGEEGLTLHGRGKAEESRIGTVPEASDEGGSDQPMTMVESEEGGSTSVEEGQMRREDMEEDNSGGGIGKIDKTQIIFEQEDVERAIKIRPVPPPVPGHDQKEEGRKERKRRAAEENGKMSRAARVEACRVHFAGILNEQRREDGKMTHGIHKLQAPTTNKKEREAAEIMRARMWLNLVEGGNGGQRKQEGQEPPEADGEQRKKEQEEARKTEEAIREAVEEEDRRADMARMRALANNKQRPFYPAMKTPDLRDQEERRCMEGAKAGKKKRRTKKDRKGPEAKGATEGEKAKGAVEETQVGSNEGGRKAPSTDQDGTDETRRPRRGG